MATKFRIVELVRDRNLHVETSNRAFPKKFQSQLQRGATFRRAKGPELRRLLEELISKNMAMADYEVENEFPSPARHTMLQDSRYSGTQRKL
jgi:hypothetical protein